MKPIVWSPISIWLVAYKMNKRKTSGRCIQGRPCEDIWICRPGRYTSKNPTLVSPVIFDLQFLNLKKKKKIYIYIFKLFCHILLYFVIFLQVNELINEIKVTKGNFFFSHTLHRIWHWTKNTLCKLVD